MCVCVLKLELSEGIILALRLQVAEGHLEHTAHEGVLSELEALGLGGDGHADLTLSEEVRGLDIVPFLLGEGINAVFECVGA